MLGPWEFSGGLGHVYSACVSLRCAGCRAGTILFGYAVVWAAGPYGFFLSLAVYWRVRYGRIGEGGGPLFFCFLQFAVNFLGGWVSAVGIFSCFYIFCWWFRSIFLRFFILEVADCQ